jgi:hypothetical protein
MYGCACVDIVRISLLLVRIVRGAS